MTEAEVQELRALAWHQATLAFVNSETVDELVAELRERDATLAAARDSIRYLDMMKAEAEAKLARVRSIHKSEPQYDQRPPLCQGCGHLFPCPTIRALADPPRTEGGTDVGLLL